MSYVDDMIANGQIPDVDTCVRDLVDVVNSRMRSDAPRWRIYGNCWVDAKDLLGPGQVSIIHLCQPQKTWWYYQVTKAGALDGWANLRGKAIMFKEPGDTLYRVLCDRCKDEPQGGLRMALLLHYNQVAKKS